MMNAKNIILATLFALLATFAVYLFYSRFKTPEGLKGEYDVSTEQIRLYGEDGTILPTTISRADMDSSEGPAGAVFLHPDRGLDASWNSSGISFGTGTFIRKSLASHGYLAVSYDQRGTGESVVSGRNRPTPKNLTRDLLSVYRSVSDRVRTGEQLVFLGHGEGCVTALQAALDVVDSKDRTPRSSAQQSPEDVRVVLTNCAFSGTLLKNWGKRLIHNMEKSQVDPEIIENARSTLSFWLGKQADEAGGSRPAQRSRKSQESQNTRGSQEGLKEGEIQNGGIPETEEQKEHLKPDLIAFYNALNYMESAEMDQWTSQAARLDVPGLIRKSLERGVQVTLLAGSLDEEIPPSEWKAMKELSQQIQENRHRYRASLTIQQVPNTDHFLIHRGGRSSSIMQTALRRMNPFYSFSERFMEQILKALSSER